nr:MAG TPA: hypothetical protein [Caudoviricetes sp.]
MHCFRLRLQRYGILCEKPNFFHAILRVQIC